MQGHLKSCHPKEANSESNSGISSLLLTNAESSAGQHEPASSRKPLLTADFSLAFPSLLMESPCGPVSLHLTLRGGL